jgi:outer membrane receptor protein involved in Fe transport
MIRRILVRAVFSLSIPVLAYGQIGGGSVVGNVTDPGGAAVAAAKVIAIQARTGARNETITNEQGYYEFPLLAVGNYRLEVEKTGFKRSSTASFDLNGGTRPRFDLRLELGQVSESVEVVASAPLVNATTTDLGVVISQSKVDALPLNGRNFQQLVGLQPGVVNAPSSSVGGRGGIEFNGSPAFGNNLLMDGVDMSFGENNAAGDTAAGTGGAGALINTVSVEAIEEFKATGSAFSAEYGRATGGVLNVTTKSGSNQFHGTAYHFFRNDKLDANSFFNNRSGLVRPPLRQNQYGANLGGPIKRDRAFFFFNYEGATVRRASQVVGNVPTPALLAQVTPAIRQNLDGLPKDFTPTTNPLIGLHRRNDSRTNDELTTLSRGDLQLGAHRLSLRYNYNNQDFASPNLRPANRFTYPNRFHNALVQDSWNISPTMFNELRLGFNRNDLNRNNSTLFTLPGWLEVAGVSLASDFQSQIHFVTNSYTVADNFTWIRGSHTIKAGFEYRDLRSSRLQATNPTHFFNTLDDLIADRPNTIRLTFGNPGRGQTTSQTGLFLQDDWRVSKRLQLNIGLRYEYYTPIKGPFNIAGSDPFGSFGEKGSGIFRPDRNNFAPRLGLIYDVTGRQRTILRAGAGITYAPQQPFFYYDMSFIDPRIPFNAVFSREDLPPNVSMAFPFPQAFASSIIANPSGLPRNLLLGRGLVDFNRRDEYSGQWNFSLQHSVTETLAVQASYVGSRALKLMAVSVPNQFRRDGGTRPRADIGDVIYREASGNSSYHSMQLSVNQRLKYGLSADFYYTWARGMSYFGSDANFGTGEGTVQDFSNIAGSYGPKTSDVRHRWTFVHSYNIPTPASWSKARFLIGGWAVQGIMGWRSGLPVNVTSGVDFVGNRRVAGQRPDYVSGTDPYAKDLDALTWLNPAAFSNAVPAAQRRFGSLGFNALRGPTAFTYDAAIHKQFNLTERQRLQFRLEMFNALNHATFSNPDGNRAGPNFGRILGASGGRNLQLALKYAF